MATVNANEVYQKALSVPEQAKGLKIVDGTSYQRGGQVLVMIKKLRAEVNETFDPIIKKAHEAHREAIAKKKKVEAPLIEAENIVKPAMAAYDTLQRQRVEAERRRLEEEARKRAEDEALAAALHAEKQGEIEEAEAIINEPLEVAPIVQPAATKVAGVSYRENWTADITDMMALVKAVAAGEQPLSLLVINMPALNQMARALKAELKIPGVKAVCHKIVAASKGMEVSE